MSEEVNEEAKALEDMTSSELAFHIRALVLDSRKSAQNRKRRISKGDLKALAAWERDITSNYGVVK